MDWTALLIGAIPSIVSLLTLIVQVARDRRKDQAVAGRTRAEAAQELATGEKTRAEATEKIVHMYEGYIEILEERIKALEEELLDRDITPPQEPEVPPSLST